MARTIAEIQNEILIEKGKQSSLNNLTDSKTAIWKLWINIVATAIWIHEKIVEKNALISRPHTLNWYRSQALNFHYGLTSTSDSNSKIPFLWKDGSYQFDTTGLDETEIEKLKIIKHCAVSEIDLETVLDPTQKKDRETIFSDYFRNKVGVVFLKVATVKGDKISRIDVPNELYAFKEYMAKIKDAGNHIHISSDNGDILKLNLTVYVDPLNIYIDPANPANPKNGSLILNEKIFPVQDAVKEHLKSIEFNGAFVKTYFVDALQNTPGIKIPVVNKVETSWAKNPNDQLSPPLEDVTKTEYFIPNSGYFDLDALEIQVNYIPYTFYRDKQ
ncbi:hypothetical protein [Flavobacterium tructae]|uniref:Nucleotidyltransferase n=1 Tax=Flavobacterium tructae TaxID=1114873 RepID=A0A1S1J5Y2_9FLAO|nr:hypothetical protein [Flavobacterium tructae]OHT45011.1 hypothetical protein BHE19_09870 [Flavobacterium tructae]OXB16637.1 hypothetical protein B0A71_19430 [Flavobacterium tructae]OXB20647.1 hypothetical protein B0A80_18635 [Flavobacterium tructae]